MVISLYYLKWHYSRGFRDLFILWGNYLWALVHLFSLPLLAATLFAPWKRLHETRTKGFDIEDMLTTFVVNIIMRLVGFFVRITTIFVGLALVLAVSAIAALSFVAWAVFPAFIGALVGVGIIFTF